MKQRDHMKLSGNIVKYQKLRNKCVNVIRAIKQKHYELLLLNAKGNCKKLWSHIHGLTKEPKTTIPKTRCESNTIILDKNHRANRLDSHYVTVATRTQGEISVEISVCKILSVLKTILKAIIKRTLTLLFQRLLIENELNKMSVKKAADDDDVSVTLLQKCKSVILPTLFYLMNESITQGEFPQLWKMAKVTPLFKGGERTDLNHYYRPISVLNIILKVLERHVYNHLYSYLNELNLLMENKSGFRNGYSGETYLTNMTNI